MFGVLLKNKINIILEDLNENHLHAAYSILKKLLNQQKVKDTQFDKSFVDLKIATGINQLDNNEGTDFGSFLNEVETNYYK